MSTAKSMFIHRESDVWDSLWSQRAVLTEANERLAQRSTEVADLRLLCDELKSEAVSAQAEALSAREQVASQVEEMRQRQLELGQAIGERDQSRSQAAEVVSRAEALRGQLAEATERLAEASARAGTLAESQAETVGSAQSAQAEASQQRAQAEGMPCPLCDFVFVSILLLSSEGSCPAVCRVRDGS
jgi:DNA repair exonuclease SbcCD ATPase subunit